MWSGVRGEGEEGSFERDVAGEGGEAMLCLRVVVVDSLIVIVASL